MTIQDWLDKGVGVDLPPWDVTIDRPLVLREPGTQLRGHPSGKSRLFGTFGSGPLVLVQPARPFPNVAYKPMLLLADVRSLYDPVPQTLHVTYEITRASAPWTGGAATHVYCGCDYGFFRHTAWAVFDWFGGLQVVWDGVTHDAPLGYADEVGVKYTIDLIYDGVSVRLMVDGVTVVWFPYTGPVPQLPMGVDAVALGFDCGGPFGTMQGTGPIDAVFGSLRINNFFTDLVSNDGVFLKTSQGYVLPNSVETQNGPYVVSDITFMGQQGASGLLLYDAIHSRVERVDFVQSWHGFETRGTTYAGSFEHFGGTCLSVAWLQTGQSEATYAADVNASAAGISMVVAGPVGGSYNKVFVAPLGGSFASLYARDTHEFNVFGGQIDDEGQAGPVRAGVVVDAATVKLSGVLLARNTPGPVVTCSRGGSLHLWGSWLGTQPGSAEAIHFVDPPAEPYSVTGCRETAGVPLTVVSDQP